MNEESVNIVIEKLNEKLDEIRKRAEELKVEINTGHSTKSSLGEYAQRMIEIDALQEEVTLLRGRLNKRTA